MHISGLRKINLQDIFQYDSNTKKFTIFAFLTPLRNKIDNILPVDGISGMVVITVPVTIGVTRKKKNIHDK